MIDPQALERLLLVMSKHGVTHLEAGDGIVIRRVLPAEPAEKRDRESPLERLGRLSPEDQDRMLRLGHLGGEPHPGRRQ